jgi:hypothetical protein
MFSSFKGNYRSFQTAFGNSRARDIFHMFVMFMTWTKWTAWTKWTD